MNESVSQNDPLNFDAQVLQSELPVLVDYWAEWCAPCKALLPVLDEVAKEYRDRLRLVKVNVEQEPQIAAQGLYRTESVAIIGDSPQNELNLLMPGIRNGPNHVCITPPQPHECHQHHEDAA